MHHLDPKDLSVVQDFWPKFATGDSDGKHIETMACAVRSMSVG